MPSNDPLPSGWRRTITGYAISPEQAQYLEAGLGRGLSTAETLRQLRAGGISITTQAAYDLAAELRGAQLSATRASRAVPAYVPQHTDYQQVIQRMPLRYRVTGEINLGDVQINGRSTFGGFHLTDKLLTVGEHRAAVFRAFSGVLAAYKQAFDEAGIEITEDDIDFVKFESFLS